MSTDEIHPSKRRFWSGILRSLSTKKTAKLEKERPWKEEDDEPTVETPPVQPSQPVRPQGGLVRAQTQVRKQNTIPEQQPLPRQRVRRESKERVPSRRTTPPTAAASVPATPAPPGPLAPPGATAAWRKHRESVIPDGRSQVVLQPGPLTEWPPWGVPVKAELPLSSAMELIARGAPIHNGHKRDVPHAPDDYYTLYTTSSGNQPDAMASSRSGRRSRVQLGRDRSLSSRRGDRVPRREEAAGSPADGTDGADLYDSMMELMTMRTAQTPRSAHLPVLYPWETLEQPSFAFCFGRRPGTVTLNHWAGQSGVQPPSIALRDSGVRPRDVSLIEICQRLRELQRDGLEDDDQERLYRNLYRRLLRDPDRGSSPRRTLDKQITDLIMALSRPDYWIDFTAARNQIVTRFIFDTGLASHQQYGRFFHQLLLSIELDLRISSRLHDEWAKEKLMQQLPPTLQYDLALARRWREHVRIESYGKTADQVQLRLKLKSRQIRLLRRFARAMKWPNQAAMVANLKQRDADGSLESISSHVMAFFSGLVLPGPTYPFVLMNALIDIDPDRATDDLSMLTHIHPHCGFQYRNSYTYWTSTSIVGKVLAPTCRELAGWVGPARPSVDLGRSQIARIRSRRPRQRLTVDDVVSMNDRSDPLGPTSELFPIADYKLVATDPTNIIDTVRIELLSLRPAPKPDGPGGNVGGTSKSPGWFDASVQFAIDGVSWPLRLNFDVSFISAWPCSNGPHPLFFDYAFAVIKADTVVDVHDWANSASSYGKGHGHSRTSSPTVHFGSTRILGQQQNPPVSKDGDEDKVLVIEAFGVPDNEVLARAWCAHWGLGAIVADVKTTWAYAATITVVILVDGQVINSDE
ncbi:hypothetical protein CMQ_4727 [Grosmannia clavigera kw1407]|uniref:Tpr domain containing protein n=1 Tax=Grosmannia clavigera (strain kw1407 / UAMH 11150) TaxID=655863 RepID=F0XTM3_GROCL|nr:uncharacterized protein CMQ_4727 [Grosmannia clavigera kw1407]EFW98875.1 hypothetical protein CMQ_4727 [Grosmannia clavigera kw1407]